MNSTLKIEGQGTPLNGMPCRRIATAFTNDHGERIFFSAEGCEKPTDRRYRKYYEMPWKAYGSTDAAFTITDDVPNDDQNRHRLPQQVRQARPWQIGTFEFTRAGLLDYINNQFHSSFTGLEIVTDFTYKPMDTINRR